MLFTAFFNLLHNACKYSDEGSDVIIRIMRDGNDVLIECIDQGVGFPDGEVADLFQKYRRGANALHVGGAGVGLFMVYKIVSKYHGVLQLVRPPSGGTCMQLRLPELLKNSKK